MSYRTIAAPDGLFAGIWEPENDPRATVLAVHGITASHRAWALLPDALPGVRIIAPDLRGRGRSRDLQGPWGMRRHADDLARVLDAAGVDSATLVGHSMGAFASVTLAHAHPDRSSGIVLVDGGLPLPTVPLDDGQDAALRLLGPAAERLRMTFPDAVSYRAFWRAHPAFVRDWSPVVQQYVDYDLIGTAPDLHSSSVLDAVAADALELNGDPGYRNALASLSGPITLLRAPRGLLDQPGGLYSPEAIERWGRDVPAVVARDVDDVNHYTILMTPHGIEAVATAIDDVIIRTTP